MKIDKIGLIEGVCLLDSLNTRKISNKEIEAKTAEIFTPETLETISENCKKSIDAIFAEMGI